MQIETPPPPTSDPATPAPATPPSAVAQTAPSTPPPATADTSAEQAPAATTEPAAADQSPDNPQKEPGEPRQRRSADWNRALAREQRLRQERQQLEAQRQQLEAERQQWQQERDELARQAALVDELKANPTKFLELTGLTLDQFTEAYLKGGAPDLALRQIEEKLTGRVSELEQQLQKEREEQKRLQEEAEQRAQQESLQQWRSRVEHEVSSAGTERYPYITAAGAQAQVHAEIEAHYERTGAILNTDEAAQIVEQRLAQAVPTELSRLLSIPAIRDFLQSEVAKLNPPTAPTTEAAPTSTTQTQSSSEPPPPSSRPSVTLTNADAARTISLGRRDQSPDELWKEVLGQAR